MERVFLCFFAVLLSQNVDAFMSVGKTDSSITLQWTKNSLVSGYVLAYNAIEVNIPVPSGDGPVTFAVSSLTAETVYTFTLYSVSGSTRDSGVQLTVVTGHQPVPCGQTYCQYDTDCITLSGTAQCVDPCDVYTPVNDAWRSVNNTDTSTIRCDQRVEWVGWYRMFLGQSDAWIPEACVPERRCGTDAPLWLTEHHPTQYQNIETRAVCGAWSGSCCNFKSNPIKVKRCVGDFFVYKLAKSSSCSLTYCAGFPTPLGIQEKKIIVPVFQKVLRLELQSSIFVDMKDPVVQERLQQQLQQKLRDRGVNGNVTLS